jgi:hypothetical protein
MLRRVLRYKFTMVWRNIGKHLSVYTASHIFHRHHRENVKTLWRYCVLSRVRNRCGPAHLVDRVHWVPEALSMRGGKRVGA